jgi:hypothetical protein
MLDTVGQINEIISGMLFSANIEDANERLECAKAVAALIGRDPSFEAPRDGVLLHFSKGNGVTELIIKSDPPRGRGPAIKRILNELADTLEGQRFEKEMP